MDDVERLAGFVLRLVRGMQPVQHVRHDGRADGQRYALAGGPRRAQQARQ